MSVTVDYYFNLDCSLQELGRRAGDVLGVRFEPYQGDPEDLFCRFLSMELSLGRHTMENDGDCNFEDFAFELGLRVAAPDIDLLAYQVEAMVLIAYALHRRMQVNAGLLVWDVQVPIARYVTEVCEDDDGTPCLIDLISGNSVRFPEHLVEVAERIHRHR